MAGLESDVFDFTMTGNGTLTEFLLKVNEFTDIGQGGFIGILILITIGATLFMMMKSYGNERALGVSMFITSLIGVFLRILGLINDFVLYICIAIMIGGILLLLKEAAPHEL